MADIRVPTLGESVTEATVGKWFKQPGEAVAVDEPVVELETDKVTLEVPAPAAGETGRCRSGREGSRAAEAGACTGGQSCRHAHSRGLARGAHNAYAAVGA